MTDTWREFLYPLGFLSAIAFTGRMLVQWLGSEAKGISRVTPLFWKLSLAGNISLAVHAFIQVQFHVCLIQVCNGIISWRNLNLMQPFDKQISTKKTLFLMAAGVIFTFLIFQLNGAADWFRVPLTPWTQSTSALSILWHIFGFCGLALFSSRFWIQWWSAEKRKTSYLGPTFWWVSLIGEAICLVYFVKIHDPVNFIGPAFAMIPYIRNLMLLRKLEHKGANT